MAEESATTQTINVPHPTPTPVSTVFPQEIEVTLILKLTVGSQEKRDDWLEPGTNVIQIYALADVFDILGNDGVILNSLNGLTLSQIQNALNTREI
jgi:hypothetical protein